MSQFKPSLIQDLSDLSKEELICRIQALQQHNLQLKNIIAKSQDPKGNKQYRQKPFDFTKCTYRRIFLKIMYLGWDYQGFASQEDTTSTIEYNLFKALIRTCLIKDRASSNYHRCGRTDKGVSAFGQVISLNVRSKLTKENINNVEDEIDYCDMLNRILPENIQCIAWSPVEEEFSARFNCQKRTYKYFFPKADLNIEKMRQASNYLIGTHDFRNFCKLDVGNGVFEYVRNITEIEFKLLNNLEEENDDEYQMYVITIVGKAFLWHQIRCIMTILFLIGQGNEEPELIKELFDVEKNPRKPDYNLASEIPLNLFQCDYDNINWVYKEEALQMVIKKLKQMWTFTSVQENMMKLMLDNLNATSVSSGFNAITYSSSNFLISGVRTKRYVPVMKRQLCDSLEDKIEHYSKKKTIVKHKLKKNGHLLKKHK